MGCNNSKNTVNQVEEPETPGTTNPLITCEVNVADAQLFFDRLVAKVKAKVAYSSLVVFPITILNNVVNHL